MGNTEAKLGPEFVKKLNYYQFDRNVDDYRIGKAQIWTRKGTRGPADGPDLGEKVLVKEKWSMTAAEASKYNQYMKLRKGIRHPNLCEIIETESLEESSWCSKYYKTHIATEFHTEHLAEELNRRRRLTRDDPGKWMTEPSLWYLVKAVSSAALELERNGLLHGDIQPRNILITADERIKLFEAPMLNQYFTGYNRMLQEADYSAALSPQELDALRHDLVYRSIKQTALTGDSYEAKPVSNPVQQQVNNQIANSTAPGNRPVDSNAALSQFLLNATNNGVDNLGRSTYGEPIKRSNLDGSFPDLQVVHVHDEKDDVFSLGITALCAITNNPVADFYDMNTVNLNEAKVNQKLQFLRELNYSPQAITLITSMIQADPARRPTMAQVLQACAPGAQVQAPTVRPLAGGNFTAFPNQQQPGVNAQAQAQAGNAQQRPFGNQQAAAAGVGAFNQGFNQAAQGAPQPVPQQGAQFAPQGAQFAPRPQAVAAPVGFQGQTGFQGQAGYQAPAAIRQSGVAPAGPNPYYGAQSQYVAQPQAVYGR